MLNKLKKVVNNENEFVRKKYTQNEVNPKQFTIKKVDIRKKLMSI